MGGVPLMVWEGLVAPISFGHPLAWGPQWLKGPIRLESGDPIGMGGPIGKMFFMG